MGDGSFGVADLPLWLVFSALEETTMREAIAYIRVSTNRQVSDGASLQAQRAKIEAYCLANELILVRVYADEGISAASLQNRPGAQEAIAEAARRHCPLVIYSLSRLVRSVTDAVEVGNRLQKARADIISLSENIDSSTVSGRFVYRLLGLLGELERDLVSERTRAVMSNMRLAGRRVGAVPFGYRLAEDNETLLPDTTEQHVIELMHTLREGGASYATIARTLEERGIKTKSGRSSWLAKVVNAILTRDRELRS